MKLLSIKIFSLLLSLTFMQMDSSFAGSLKIQGSGLDFDFGKKGLPLPAERRDINLNYRWSYEVFPENSQMHLVWETLKNKSSYWKHPLNYGAFLIDDFGNNTYSYPYERYFQTIFQDLHDATMFLYKGNVLYPSELALMSESEFTQMAENGICQISLLHSDRKEGSSAIIWSKNTSLKNGVYSDGSNYAHIESGVSGLNLSADHYELYYSALLLMPMTSDGKTHSHYFDNTDYLLIGCKVISKNRDFSNAYKNTSFFGLLQKHFGPKYTIELVPQN